jgi:hypothetical protein
MSNLMALPANWNLIKGKLKQTFATITDREMILGRYKREELVARIKVQIVKSKADLERFFYTL